MAMTPGAAVAAGAVASAGRQMQTKPQRQPGQMIQQARSRAVGGGQATPPISGLPLGPQPTGRHPVNAGGEMQMPGPAPDIGNVAVRPPAFGVPGQQLGVGGAGDVDQALQPPPPGVGRGMAAGMPGMQPGGGPPMADPQQAGGRQLGVQAPGAGPDEQLHGMPTGPNTAGGGLNPNPPQPGGGMPISLPPGASLPPHLQAAVQAGHLDPQAAFDRAMQNRQGFRDRMMGMQQPGPPPAPPVRNLSDVYRQNRRLPTKPGGDRPPTGIHVPFPAAQGGPGGMQYQRPTNGYDY